MMEDLLVYPRIAAPDYAVFLALPGSDLPPTHAEFLAMAAHVKRDYEMKGGHVVDQDVTPAEFTRYCRYIGSPAILQRLGGFAMEKRGGRSF